MRFHNLKRNRGARNLLSILTVLLFWVLVGCGGSSPPSIPAKKAPSLPAKKEALKVAEKKEVEKKEEPEYTYNPAGKPDPFKPFLQLTPVREVSRVPQTPLQRYEISQLKLVAIISSPEGNIAMVEDSSGKGYFLKKGTLIGKNYGKVTKILKDKVIIEEVYLDIFGQTKTHEISILLHRMEEGGES